MKTLLLLLPTCLLLGSARAAEPVPADVTAILKKSADWQLAHPSGIEIRDWIIAPLYDGLLRTAVATGDGKYLAAVIRFGTQAGWQPGDLFYHADDHAVGHAWLDVYLMDSTQKQRLAPMADRLSRVISNPVTEALSFGKKPTKKGVAITDRWSWCDALYMAPPYAGSLACRHGGGQVPRVHGQGISLYL